MIQQKKEWTDVKELTPLNFMPYVAKLFKEVTSKDLQGLGQFTGWIGMGGYYHWRVAQQGLIHLVPHLQDEPRPRTPKSRPSGQPLPPRLAPTGTPATGASVGQMGVAQPTPQGGGQRPALNQEVAKGPLQVKEEVHLHPARVEGLPPQARVGGHRLPAKVVDWPQ